MTPDVLALLGLCSLLALSAALPLSCGLPFLGGSAFVVCGALGSGLLLRETNLPILAAVLGGGLAAVVPGLLISLPLLRLEPTRFALTSLALGVLSAAVPLGLERAGAPAVASSVWVALALMLPAGGLMLRQRIAGSRFGRAIDAVREDPNAAEASGIDVHSLQTAVLALSALSAGLAGALATQLAGMPLLADRGLGLSIAMLAMATLGGPLTVSGPVLGAALYALVSTICPPDPAWHTLLAAVALLIAVLGLPGGLRPAPGSARWRWPW